MNTKKSSTRPAPLAKQNGLKVQTCECGETAWAFPWDDAAAAWDAHQRHPLRGYLEEKGLAPPEPRFSHHVIVADARDGNLLGERRWRVYPSKPWMPHRVEARGGEGRGLPLHRHLTEGEKWVQIVSGYGCDVRPRNLRQMTRDEVTTAMRARKRGATIRAR